MLKYVNSNNDLLIVTKRLLVILSFTTLVFFLAACSDDRGVESINNDSYSSSNNSLQSNEGAGNNSPEVANASEGNILIAYFTVPEMDGVDTVSGASRIEVESEILGNNQYVAQLIQQIVGGDLFQIETIQEYPTQEALRDFAREERAENSRPELATQIEELESYDVIFLGFPNWLADLPMPLYTFLEAYDFNDKTIIPFTVHGGSGFSSTIDTISEIQPNAIVLSNGFSISRDNVLDTQAEVRNWIQSFGLLSQ